MNQAAILAVPPDSKDDAKFLKESTHALSLELNSYIDWIRAQRRLPSFLFQAASKLDRASQVIWRM